MISLLVTIGWILLVVGIILILLGYTVAAGALRPGFGAVILGVVLLILGYLIPAVTTPHDDTYNGATSVSSIH